MTISLLSIAGAVLLLLSSDLLIVVFVLELKFILLGSPLPAFLFPSLTPHDLLLIAQAMKPAIMHCSKAIFSSLYVNPLDILSQNAISVTATQKVLNGKFVKLLKQIQNVSKKDRTMVSVKETTRETSSAQEEKTDGSISCILRTLHHRVQKEDPKDVNRGVERVALMMKKSEEPATSPPAPFPLYYLAIYVLSRWLFYQRRS